MATIVDVNFNPPPDFEHHQCQATRNGDWIIFRCSQCEDYERRLNWRTGETRARNVSATIHHNGGYKPSEFQDAFTNLN